MKKLFARLLIAVTTVAAIFMFGGCFNAEDPTSTPATDSYYTVNYLDGTEIIASRLVKNKYYAPEITLPEKEGYIFDYWALAGYEYDFSSPVTTNISLYAVWKTVTYTINFMADGELKGSVDYTVKTDSITPPDIPEKAGYSGKWDWDNAVKAGNTTTVTAVYSPITYFVYFYANHKLIATEQYTIENPTVTLPEITEMLEGYTAHWPEFELTYGDRNIEAEYTLIGNLSPDETTDPDGNTDRDLTLTDTSPEQPNINPADEEEIPVVSGFTAVTVDGGCQITGFEEGYENTEDVFIPAFYKGVKVVSVGGNFEGNTRIKSLTIANGVEIIQAQAFNECTSLKEINLPSTIKTIGNYAFSYTAVTQLEIPAGEIGTSAFYGCEELESLTLGDGVQSIGKTAFFKCSALKTLKIGTGVTKIAAKAFGNCNLLQTIEFAVTEGWKTANGNAVTGLDDRATAIKYLVTNAEQLTR